MPSLQGRNTWRDGKPTHGLTGQVTMGNLTMTGKTETTGESRASPITLDIQVRVSRSKFRAGAAALAA